MQSCKLQMKNEVNLSIPPSTPFRRRRVKSRPSNIVFCFLNIQFFFLLNHSLCSSGKDFEVSSSSSDSALAGVSVFGGICIVFSGMCGSVERFRQRMKLEIADRDIVIPFPARLL